MKTVFVLLLMIVVSCGYSVEKIIQTVEVQADNPAKSEYVFEYGKIDKGVAQDILNDIKDKIDWSWTRLKFNKDKYILIGNVSKNGNRYIGRYFNLEKVDTKWVMSGDGKYIVFEP